jgi:hypothetical protein
VVANFVAEANDFKTRNAISAVVAGANSPIAHRGVNA